jgi:hypothetical protein
MINDGRLLAILAIGGLLATSTVAHGSRGVVRAGRKKQDDYITDVVWACNALTSNSPGKPHVDADDGTSILAWLRWNDRNGDYEDELANNLDDAHATLMAVWDPVMIAELREEVERERLQRELEQHGSRGVVRAGKTEPSTHYKPGKLDYRPRTRPGFYRRGKDFIRIDAVDFSYHRQPGRILGVNDYLGPDDWWIYGVGTLGVVDKTGPTGHSATSIEMRIYQFTSAGYRKVKPEQVPADWKAWFDRNAP